MAVSTKVLTFTWENKDEFKLEENTNGAGNIIIINMEENGDIADLFAQGIAEALKHYCSDLIDKIVEEMKA